jgi:altronate dehydratase small subunit
MSKYALIVHKRDNVATALQNLGNGDLIKVEIENLIYEIELSQSIKFGHKFSLQEINKGNAVIKYGEKIGIASLKIRQGQHVHLHNVEGFRGRGDKK